MAPPSSPSPAGRSSGAAARIGLRNGFYRDGWRTMTFSLPVLAVALLIDTGVDVYQALKPPNDHYFVTDSETGRILPVVPSNLPYVSQQFLLSWVSEAVTGSLTMDFMNYQSQLQGIRKNFTKAGYDQYLAALNDSKMLQFITANMLVSASTPLGVPIVVNNGVVNGVYVWKVEIPVLVDFRNKAEKTSKKYLVTLVVVRVPTTEHSTGIGISQFIAREV